MQTLIQTATLSARWNAGALHEVLCVPSAVRTVGDLTALPSMFPSSCLPAEPPESITCEVNMSVRDVSKAFSSALMGFAVWLLLSSIAHPQEAGGGETQKLFDDIHARYKEHRKTAERLSLSFDLQVTTHSTRSPVKKQTTAKLYWDGKDLLAESDTFAYVSTPFRAFILRRPAAPEPWGISVVTPVSETERSVRDIIMVDKQVESISDELLRPTKIIRFVGDLSNVTPIRTRQLDRHTLLPDGRIRFDISAKPDVELRTMAATGYAIVDPQVANVVDFKNTVGRERGAVQLDSQFSYYPPTSDIPAPLVKTYSHHQLVSGSKVGDVYQIAIYSNYRVEPVPRDRLTLEYYGLPDPAVTRGAWPKTWLLIIGIGLALFVGVVFVRRRGRVGVTS